MSTDITMPKIKEAERLVIERGKVEGRQEGITEGMEKGKIEAAKSMLIKGFSLGDISEITGLSIKQVKTLK